MVALAARAKKFEESRNFEGVFRVHQARRRSLIHRGRERGWASHLPVDCVGTLMHRLHATVEGGLPARTRHFAHARTRAKTAFPPSPWHSLFSFFFFLSLQASNQFSSLSDIFTLHSYTYFGDITRPINDYFFPRLPRNLLLLFVRIFFFFFTIFTSIFNPIFSPSKAAWVSIFKSVARIPHSVECGGCNFPW